MEWAQGGPDCGRMRRFVRLRIPALTSHNLYYVNSESQRLATDSIQGWQNHVIGLPVIHEVEVAGLPVAQPEAGATRRSATRG